MSPLLVAALGNPGRAYADTRHNLGWVVVEALAARLGLRWQAEPRFSAEVARGELAPGRPGWLLKPTTFMNESGRAVRAFTDFHRLPVDSVVLVYDDVGIDLGLVKVSVTGGPGGHNGVASVLSHLGNGFVRYRLGIGPRQPAAMDLKDFVLGAFTAEQRQTIEQQLSTHYLPGLQLLLANGVERAMNLLNRRDQNEPDQT